ncbi:MAG: hypothetical protein H7832_07580 [Magnetococcus sp. DMHC-6]
MLKNVKLLSLAGTLVLGVGVMACGGGGGSNEDTTPAVTEVEGSAVDGPIANAVVSCLKSDGTEDSAFKALNLRTGLDGKYKYNVNQYPNCVTMVLSPATDGRSYDVMTGQDMNMVLKSFPPEDGKPAFASPLSTILAETPASERSALLSSLGFDVTGGVDAAVAAVMKQDPYEVKGSDAEKALATKVAQLNSVVSQVYSSVVKLAESSTTTSSTTLSTTAFTGIMQSVATTVKENATIIKDISTSATASSTQTNTLLSAAITNLPTSVTSVVNKDSMTVYKEVAASELATTTQTVQASVNSAITTGKFTGSAKIVDSATELKDTSSKAAKSDSVGEVKKVVDAIVATSTTPLTAAQHLDLAAALSSTVAADSTAMTALIEGSSAGTGVTSSTALATINTAVTTAVSTNCNTCSAVNLEEVFAIKGLACSGNSITLGTSGSNTVSYSDSGSVANTPTASKSDVVFSCMVEGYNNGTGKAVVTQTYTTGLSVYMKDKSGKREITTSLSPVSIVVTAGADPASVSPSNVTVSFPAAKVAYSGKDSDGKSVSGSIASPTGLNNVIFSSGTELKIDLNKYLELVENNEPSNSSLKVVNTSGTYTFELGFTGQIDLGFSSNGKLTKLIPADGTKVSGQVIDGTVKLQ